MPSRHDPYNYDEMESSLPLGEYLLSSERDSCKIEQDNARDGHEERDDQHSSGVQDQYPDQRGDIDCSEGNGH